MKGRFVALVFALICTAAGMTASTPAAAQPHPLELTLKLDRQLYEPGVAMLFTLQVKNVTSTPYTATFGSIQKWDIIITGSTGEITRWSNGRLFATVINEQTWRPGETVTFTDIWTPTLEAPGGVLQPNTQSLGAGIINVYAELRNVGTRPRSPALTVLVGRAKVVGTGCAPLVNPFGQVLPSFFRLLVDPASTPYVIWVYDTAQNRFNAYYTDPQAPVDLISVRVLAPMTICVASGRILLPE